MKLNAKQLRVSKPSARQLAKISRRPIYIILDNVVDTYNIGSLFRLADAVAAREVLLCGRTETPPSSRIHKAAIGTEEWVPWQYAADAATAISELKSLHPKLRVVAIEQDPRAVPVTSPSVPLLTKERVERGEVWAVVVGHETDGVSREALGMADVIVEIPVFGVNRSLNVHVSAAIVLYHLLAL